jgi:hypothetical protein
MVSQAGVPPDIKKYFGVLPQKKRKYTFHL